MGTATVEKTPTNNYFPTDQNYRNKLDTLKNNIQLGKIITYADINDLQTLINSWRTHYHRYNDLYQDATFGNTGTRSPLSEIKDTGGAIGQVTNLEIPLLAAPPSETITRAYQNQLASVCNLLGTHVHNINDRIKN